MSRHSCAGYDGYKVRAHTRDFMLDPRSAVISRVYHLCVAMRSLHNFIEITTAHVNIVILLTKSLAFLYDWSQTISNAEIAVKILCYPALSLQ